MKKLMLALSAAMMLAACSDYTEEQTNEKHEETVRFSLSNGEITQELMTRATLADMSITDLWTDLVNKKREVLSSPFILFDDPLPEVIDFIIRQLFIIVFYLIPREWQPLR